MLPPALVFVEIPQYGLEFLDTTLASIDCQIVVASPARDRKYDIIGWVTSSRLSPTLGEAIGLCWLPVDRAVHGEPFDVFIDGRLVGAHVHDGPFYDPEGSRLKM